MRKRTPNSPRTESPPPQLTEDLSNRLQQQSLHMELADRIYVTISGLEAHCLDHPISQTNPQLHQQIEYAMGQLWDAYQIAASIAFDLLPSPSQTERKWAKNSKRP